MKTVLGSWMLYAAFLFVAVVLAWTPTVNYLSTPAHGLPTRCPNCGYNAFLMEDSVYTAECYRCHAHFSTPAAKERDSR